MAKELTDDELNLRRKARRRLVGAVALTLVVVVILPMVLDSEPKPAGQDIELRIPAPDNAGKLAPGAASGVTSISPVVTSAAVVAPVSPGVPAQKANDTAIQIAAPARQPVAAATPNNEAPARVQPPVTKPSESKSENRAASGEGFVVQVGAYSNAAAAKQELNKLKNWGFKAHTEKAGDKVRVRLGPYAEREKAEKARQQLEKHGLKPVVMSVR